MTEIEKTQKLIVELEEDNKRLSEFKKQFSYFNFEIPTNLKKKIDSRKNNNDKKLYDLNLKSRRLISEAKTDIENYVI